MALQGVEALKRKMDEFSKGLFDRAENALALAITDSENEAKRFAPWTDRTGNARNSITGSGPTVDKDKMTAYLAIGMEYGVFLELCHQGRFRTIWPTLEGFARQALLTRVQNIL